MYARVTNIRFAPNSGAEVASVARGLTPILQRQHGFEGLHVLTNADTGEGIVVSLWGTEADAAAGEASPSYIGQMSMMSSFLYEPLASETYEVSVSA
jgi:heme-degrading monooxygenase HmoA